MCTKILAITGGIGSGKSVVSAMLAVLGYKVYDCDSRAKELTNNSKEIREKLISNFGNDIIECGRVNRQKLAKIVFNDKQSLDIINSIIHPAVTNDIKHWINQNSNEKLLFIETAILKESGLDELVDGVISVNAPEELRVRRVMERNNMSRNDVIKRINNQKQLNIDKVQYIINNDNINPIIPQINKLLISVL